MACVIKELAFFFKGMLESGMMYINNNSLILCIKICIYYLDLYYYKLEAKGSCLQKYVFN